MAVVEHPATACPNGHEPRPSLVVVGWHPFQWAEGHTGHRTYYCRECGVTMYDPSHAS